MKLVFLKIVIRYTAKSVKGFVDEKFSMAIVEKSFEFTSNQTGLPKKMFAVYFYPEPLKNLETDEYLTVKDIIIGN